MASNKEVASVTTALTIFVVKVMRFLSWLGTLIGLFLSLVFYIKALQVNPDYPLYGSQPFLIVAPDDLAVSFFYLSVAISGVVLSIFLQVAIVFFEHAKNQYLAADAIERLTSKL